MKIKFTYLVLAFIFIAIVSCGDDSSSKDSTAITMIDPSQIKRAETKFDILSSEFTGIKSDNKLVETKGFNHFLWASIYNGSGVGVADFDNDGLPDIYVGQNMTNDHLYHNKGGMKFEDITKTALPPNKQWTSGVTVVDINNDGFMDIYVCRFGPSMEPNERKNHLLVNQGNLTFKDEAAKYGLNDGGFTTQAAFFDVDKDGDKDVYIVNQPPDSRFLSKVQPSAQEIKEIYSDKLYVRNANGRYVDKTAEYGLQNYASGLNVLVNDVNEDGWMDLYVSNDYEKPDHLYINKGGKKFVDELEERTGHISNFAMGSDVADINNDGLNDIGVLDMSSSDHYRSKTNMGAMNEAAFWANVEKGNHYQYMFNTLQLNQGGGFYSEIAQMSRIAQTDWSWSILFEDFNLDGFKDVYVTNGIKKDIRNNDFIESMKSKIIGGNKSFEAMDLVEEIPSNPISNYYFENKGGITFSDKSKESGIYQPNFSTGCAVADFDGDGDLDIFASVSEEPSVILENKTNATSNELIYSIDKLEFNKFLNAELTVKTNCGIQRKDIVPTRGYLSSSYGKVIFGIPNECEVISATIKTIYGNDFNLPIVFGKESVLSTSNLKKGRIIEDSKANYFTESSGLNLKHKENIYNDYLAEKLLPHKLSEDGPCSITADFNGDGKDELIMGGSKDMSPQYLEHNGSEWIVKDQSFWNSLSAQENHDFLPVDIDGDDDLDLYIVNGGNESTAQGNGWLTDQLLINDGKGKFTIDNSLPKMGRNTSTAIALDIDSDGDQDIVVFGNHKIGEYPKSYNSYILENKKGKYSLSTDLDIGLDQVELVSDAIKIDYNSDGKMDILAVGSWSAPYLLIGDGSKLKWDISTELEGQASWWASISKGDFNNDGREDVVMGSFGENNKFHPTDKKPLEIFGHDFDNSGSNDIVLAKHYNNKVVPTRGRECSSQQIPDIQDKFPTFNEFALAGIEEILGEDNIKLSTHKEINGMSHLILWNTAEGWKMGQLPEECQIAPLKSTQVMDVNGDGIDDVIGIGNQYGVEVETARYDGGYGWVLLGNTNSELRYVSARNSGLWFNGDGRDLQLADLGGRKELIALFNNGKAQNYILK